MPKSRPNKTVRRSAVRRISPVIFWRPPAVAFLSEWRSLAEGRVPIVDIFGGDETKAYSVISQALLFAEMLKPTSKDQRKLRRTHGWGAGPFVIRGLWMAIQKNKAMLKNFPQLDSEMFCPGFTGALGGARIPSNSKGSALLADCPT